LETAKILGYKPKEMWIVGALLREGAERRNGGTTKSQV
jgi:hypothetical protein